MQVTMGMQDFQIIWNFFNENPFSEDYPGNGSGIEDIVVTRVMIYTRHITNLAKTDLRKFASEIH